MSQEQPVEELDSPAYRWASMPTVPGPTLPATDVLPTGAPATGAPAVLVPNQRRGEDGPPARHLHRDPSTGSSPSEITEQLPATAERAPTHRQPQASADADGPRASGHLPMTRPGAAAFPDVGPSLFSVAAVDPEHLLATHAWRFDPDTLREQLDGDEFDELKKIRELLTAKINGVADNASRARLLSLRAVVSRILGALNQALADGRHALAHAEATGELRRIAITRARLAHVLQWREEYEDADRFFLLADSTELPDRLRATLHHHAGKCAYDQGRYIEACNHFEQALDLRKEEDLELIAQTELALDAVFRRVAERGWGPYPRTREEILRLPKLPEPAYDERTRRWGFLDPTGGFWIGPGYADVQPFRDGVAWVRRPGCNAWELIDEAGTLLIGPESGYQGVSGFSDGLAWVSRDGRTDWIAIDKSEAMVISVGFDDVRPFRRGLAAVRRNARWGAVDRTGRVIVPLQFDGFTTALHDGRYIDGFTDEGLAVVSLGSRKGVVDRTGRMVVPPVYPTLMIHPVAFLVADDMQRWGALDRLGRVVILPSFAGRVDVIEEVDGLLSDVRPVL